MPSLWNISRRQVSQTVSGRGGGLSVYNRGVHEGLDFKLHIGRKSLKDFIQWSGGMATF